VAVLLATAALANHDDSFLLYPTAGPGDVTPKTVFALSETPYIYMHLPDPGPVVDPEVDNVGNLSGLRWISPSSGSFFNVNASAINAETWFSLDTGFLPGGTPTTWDAVKELGEWNVTGGFFYTGGPADFAETSFTVTPEPVSSVLFVSGGLALLAGLRKRRSRKTADLTA
jgi:hypothetical protein